MMCTLCGKPVAYGRQVLEKIDGKEFVFDKEECALICKKLNSVYGNEFCAGLTA